MARQILGQPEVEFGSKTIIGALEKHTRTPNENYQPMNSNFGILDRLTERVKGKRNRYERMAQVALAEMNRIIEEKEGSWPYKIMETTMTKKVSVSTEPHR